MNEEIPAFIELQSGEFFEALNPLESRVTIEDIAHSLSIVNRWTGHTSRPMSVAEHSVLVSHLVPEEYALQGLLHDASEAMLSDIARPFKPLIKGYKEVNDPIQAALFDAFGVIRTEESDKIVKQADITSLLTEAYHLMPGRGENWPYYEEFVEHALPGTHLLKKVIEVGKWDWGKARSEFIIRYYQLTDPDVIFSHRVEKYNVR